MKKVLLLGLILALMTACTAVDAPTEDYIDLSVCGELTEWDGHVNPGGGALVCRDLNTGECLYQVSYEEQVEGCDPEWDNYDYGNSECFEYFIDVYDADKELKAEHLDLDEMNSDNCKTVMWGELNEFLGVE
jgi:hypothetical protein